jgi:hypothetical protein
MRWVLAPRVRVVLVAVGLLLALDGGRSLWAQGMIWDHASNWDEEDVRALVAYLRAIPPIRPADPASEPPRARRLPDLHVLGCQQHRPGVPIARARRVAPLAERDHATTGPRRRTQRLAERAPRARRSADDSDRNPYFRSSGLLRCTLVTHGARSARYGGLDGPASSGRADRW